MADEIEVLPGNGFVEVRFLGSYSLDGYKGRMSSAGQACIDQKVKLLLVDLRELREFTPSTTDRYELGRYGAKSSMPGARVAMLVTPAQARDTFGATVARNLGLAIQVFTERDKAVEWLLGSTGDGSVPAKRSPS